MTDAQAWDTYGRQKADRRTVNAAGARTWFNWTQFPDHGPGTEVLGDIGPRARVIDLGCGKGGNLAHLATLGVQAVGVDLAPAQLAAARSRWADKSLALHQSNAREFLESQPAGRFDAVYSVFGAVWFTNPGHLLPAVRRVLSPRGVLAFSQRPPVEGCYGQQASYIDRQDDADPHVVRRWDYEPADWCSLLRRAGFRDPTARVIPPPPGNRRIGTLLVTAAT